MLIAKITDSEFFGGEPVYIEDDTRYNVRGILVNEDGMIAVMHLTDMEGYKLPGGSIPITESQTQALLREIHELTGRNIEIVEYLGWIEEHKAKRKFCAMTHFYVLKTVGEDFNEGILKESENRLGYYIEWLSYDDILSRIEGLMDDCKNYQLRFILKREDIILKLAKEKGLI